MRKSYIYLPKMRDPIENFALEEALFKSHQDQDHILVLWVNKPSVIIGRNQNPWLEANVRHIFEDRVPLIRRLSGGGTVFHDEGNVNFSFISGERDYDLQAHFQLILNTMKGFGIDLKQNDRSDLMYENQKVSGNAFYFRGQRRLHHGTLLIQSDEAKLWRYLTPEDLPISGKGIASKRHPVTNLSTYSKGLTVEAVIEAVVSTYKRQYLNSSIKVGFPEELLTLDQLKIYEQAKARYLSWSWTFGETPKFIFQVDTASNIKVEGGYVISREIDPSQIRLSGIRFKEDIVC